MVFRRTGGHFLMKIALGGLGVPPVLYFPG
jgi:hypothetical protein